MVDSEQLARSIAEEQVSLNTVLIKDSSVLRKIQNYVFLLFGVWSLSSLKLATSIHLRPSTVYNGLLFR